MKLRIFIASLFAMTLFIGCVKTTDIVNEPNGSNGAPANSLAASGSAAPVSIEMSTSSVNVAPGTNQQLSLTGIYEDSSHKTLDHDDVTWSTSDSNVVSISNDGVATSHKPGDAVISAKLFNGEEYSVKVYVSDAKLISIQVTPVNSTLYPGMTQQYIATGIFDDNTHQDISDMVKWKSTNEGVATITKKGSNYHVHESGDDDGKDEDNDHEEHADDDDDDDDDNNGISASGGFATVQGVGATTITAYVGKYKDHNEESKHHDKHHEKHGDKHEDKHKDKDEKHDDKKKFISGSTLLNVSSARLVSLTVSPSSASIPAGLSQQLSATGNYSDGTVKDLSSVVNWSSSDLSIASVSDITTTKGLVYAIAAGNTTITVNDPVTGLNSSATIAITPARLVSIAIMPQTTTIAKGLTQQFTATGTFTDNTIKDITLAVLGLIEFAFCFYK